MRSIPFPASSGVSGPIVDATLGGIVGLRGIVVTESATTAAAAFVRVRAGSSTGDILMSVKLVASGSFDTTFNEPLQVGLAPGGQLYVQLVSGTVEGAIRVD